MTYSETLQYLYSQTPVFHNVGAVAYKPGLANTQRLMEVFAHPYRRYKTIHVAGTNGKGSVSHFLAAVLQAAGYKTGLYTSPHLVDFGERIRINGQMIEKEYVIRFVEENKKVFETVQPSFFELTMAMAFSYFAAEKVDVAVIETGLGGRLDSTNIIEPELALITNISRDHTDFLGETLAAIAAEKAGIIKPQTPVVVGETQAETKNVFIEKAKKQNAPISFADNRFKVKKNKNLPNGKMQVELVDKSGKKTELIIGLSGIYQEKNIAAVMAAAEELNKNPFFHILPQHLYTGLANVVEITGLMGRWQILGEQPRIIADTGHNEGGLRENVAQLREETFDTLHIVFGMVKDKDVEAVLALLPRQARYYFTQAASKRAMKAEDLLSKAKKFALQGESFDTVEYAVKQAIANASKGDLVYIGGSNYVAGEAIPLFLGEK